MIEEVERDPLFARRSVFHPRKFVKDRPTGDRRRRRASRVLDKLSGMKKMPPCEQWRNDKAGAERSTRREFH
jgi:hypothetical protein